MIEHIHLYRQPNSKHCFVCGLESPVGLKLRFDDNGADETYATYTVPAEYEGFPGVTHGGIVAAMLDEIGGRVPMAKDHTRFMMTARLTVRYRKPVPTETELQIVARITKDRGRVAEAVAEIHLPDGSIAAEADMMLVALPEAHREDDLEGLGWKVYPD